MLCCALTELRLVEFGLLAMGFTYTRTIRFQDTDAAGVVYFANVLSLCHEAFEESLIAAGIEARSFFSGQDLATPIVHAEIDFYQPLFCGDRVSIQLSPRRLSESDFEIGYDIECDRTSSLQGHHLVGKALTRHVCIDPRSRTRQSLSFQLINWLKFENVS